MEELGHTPVFTCKACGDTLQKVQGVLFPCHCDGKGTEPEAPRSRSVEYPDTSSHNKWVGR